MNFPFAHVAGRAAWQERSGRRSPVRVLVGRTPRSPRAALAGDEMSRSASELDSASLHKMQAATLPEMAKPGIVWDVEPVVDGTNGKFQRACRGDWRRRVSKGWQRNLGGPARGMGPNGTGEDITSCGRVWESAGLIGAEKRGNSRGAKGPYQLHAEARR